VRCVACAPRCADDNQVPLMAVPGVAAGLVGLFGTGSDRSKKDAVGALLNLAHHGASTARDGVGCVSLSLALSCLLTLFSISILGTYRRPLVHTPPPLICVPLYYLMLASIALPSSDVLVCSTRLCPTLIWVHPLSGVYGGAAGNTQSLRETPGLLAGLRAVRGGGGSQNGKDWATNALAFLGC
jgi:hypothetical protein